MMSPLPAEHDRVKEHVTKTATLGVLYLSLGIIFKEGKNKLKACPEAQRHPKFLARRVKIQDA